MAGDRDFYVGYQKHAPPDLARFVRRLVVMVVVLAAALGAVLVAVQNRFDPGVFEFGVVKSFEGVLRERPHPLLTLDPPLEVGDAKTSRFYLVAFGKHGADREVAGLDGRRIRLQGSLIYREGETMIEVASGSVEPLEPTPATAIEGTDLGTQTLRGEIVDSKCFLGVMKPGRGKPHRACATRCISGGIPPILRVETAAGDFRHFLLVDQDGHAVNDRILDLVAEPVEITGRVFRQGDLLTLLADPADYHRL
ncbi:MAG: hypothetical protein OEM62_07625 [Acidobacteriota bacterium]|nr:hypothetical protein [Acidobacteriota bacterium]